jgi:hypothetical protein
MNQRPASAASGQFRDHYIILISLTHVERNGNKTQLSMLSINAQHSQDGGDSIGAKKKWVTKQRGNKKRKEGAKRAAKHCQKGSKKGTKKGGKREL